MKTTKDILGNCISLTEDALETQLKEDPFEALYQIKEKLESIKKIEYESNKITGEFVKSYDCINDIFYYLKLHFY